MLRDANNSMLSMGVSNPTCNVTSHQVDVMTFNVEYTVTCEGIRIFQPDSGSSLADQEGWYCERLEACALADGNDSALKDYDNLCKNVTAGPVHWQHHASEAVLDQQIAKTLSEQASSQTRASSASGGANTAAVQ